MNSQNIGGFAYRLKSTGHSSARYGACEVCGKHCSEVFMQVEMRGCPDPDDSKMDGYTFFESHGNRFGHRECLIGMQRTGVPA